MFLGPRAQTNGQAGPLIVGTAGQPVWFHPVPSNQWASNFRVQQYRGHPVLTWWQGGVAFGYGTGHGEIFDSSYRELARVQGGFGRHIDLHEFRLTPQGTALVTCTPQAVSVDLSSVGGPRSGQVFESIVQEIDVQSGRVLLEWQSLKHISVAESYLPVGNPYDYLHLNSIDVMPDGNLLVSARNTCALYKLDRRTGRVIWRLGGKRSDFAIGRGAQFFWQHHAQSLGPGTISLFDDGAGPVRSETQSRGLVLKFDRRHRNVHVARAYRHPQPVLAYAMGSVQPLPTGNVVVGWGNELVSEFAPNGQLLADFSLPVHNASYRGFRCAWRGMPANRPAVVPDTSGGKTKLYVSWNGATGVVAWLVSAGSSPSALKPVKAVTRSGFETAIPMGSASGFAKVTALDVIGRSMASSNPIPF